MLRQNTPVRADISCSNGFFYDTLLESLKKDSQFTYFTLNCFKKLGHQLHIRFRLMQVFLSTWLLIFLKCVGTKFISSFPPIVQLGHSIGCFLKGGKSREGGKHTHREIHSTKLHELLFLGNLYINSTQLQGKFQLHVSSSTN